MEIRLKRLDDDYYMQATNELGKTVESDASPEAGGHNKAMRPMEMLIAALGSCSSIDVIQILRKQRQPLDDIQIKITAEREPNAIPSLFTTIHIHYELYGNISEAKAEQACRLSMEKYCSVSMIVGKTATITWDFEVIKPS